MRRRPHGTERAGFTLLEILVVMWALTLALGLGATLFVAALRADQVSAATLRRLSQTGELADQFRADVAEAAAAPDRLDALARGPSCLILRTPDGAHVVYQWQQEQLERMVRTADGEMRRVVPVGVRVARVEFDVTDGERPLITLRLIESPARGVAWPTEVSAALGGDLR